MLACLRLVIVQKLIVSLAECDLFEEHRAAALKGDSKSTEKRAKMSTGRSEKKKRKKKRPIRDSLSLLLDTLQKKLKPLPQTQKQTPQPPPGAPT